MALRFLAMSQDDEVSDSSDAEMPSKPPVPLGPSPTPVEPKKKKKRSRRVVVKSVVEVPACVRFFSFLTGFLGRT